jgi:hypothetical protein
LIGAQIKSISKSRLIRINSTFKGVVHTTAVRVTQVRALNEGNDRLCSELAPRIGRAILVDISDVIVGPKSINQSINQSRDSLKNLDLNAKHKKDGNCLKVTFDYRNHRRLCQVD